MDFLTHSLAERPDLAAVFDNFPGSWPEFMYHDVVTEALYDGLIRAHPESCLVAVDPADEANPVARACAFPTRWSPLSAAGLPPDGYDRVLLDATVDLIAERPRDTVACALEITIRPDRRGTGLSGRMLGELRRKLAGLGYTDLIAPVRPNRKQDFPEEPMGAYLTRYRPDGLPLDPWLRTHVRAGAETVGVAPRSMTIVGTVPEWREWTGLPFDTTGDVVVPGALLPVRCDIEHGIVTYVEPNVWMHHRLTG